MGGSRTAPTTWHAFGQRAAIPALFAVLAIAFVGRGGLPGQALLPIDALFLYPPWRAHAADFGVQTPHNPLIADAILQNYSWKRFAADSYAAGQFPLWNPLILTGQPFLASAQNGSLYPLGVLFYLLPLAQAYAWFLALHLWLGAMFARWFARTLGATPLGGIVAGITFGFCGFLVVSFLWPMVVSTAIWLPALLATIELAMQRTGSRYGISPHPPPSPPGRGRGVRTTAPPLISLGAAIVGMQFLAGHLEMSLYLLLTAGIYTALRLAGEIWAGHLRHAILAGSAALAMVTLGSALAAIQLIPFAEVIRANVRGGWSDYSETVGYALPRERWIAFFVPDYFGNPSHHTYLDLVDGEIRSVEHVRANREVRHDTEWGGKNYVEGTVYLGVLPLLLALVGLLAHPRGARLALGLLALIATLFAFGTPLYALLFYGVPGVNQLHTPFRWIYPLSVCIAVLAGLGAGALSRPRECEPDAGWTDTSDQSRARAEARWGVRIGVASVSIGITLVAALLALLLFRDAATAIAARLLAGSPDLRAGFGEARVLFSYQHANLLGSSLLLAASGLALVVGARRRSALAGALALGLLVSDLFSFGIGFNGVADTGPLDLTPRSIQAIQADPTVFRVVTFGEDDTLPSNANMLFGLQDIRGYDTIILREYVEYLELIEPQRGIAYSKVAKLFDERSLASPLLDLLNVRYVLTSKTVRQPGYTLVYEGEGIRVYRNERALPRAFVVASAIPASDHAEALAAVGDPAFDPRRRVVLEGWNRSTPSASPDREAARPAQASEIVSYEGNRVVVQASAPEGGFLVLGDAFFDGWTVSVDGVVQPLLRANALFRAVELAPGLHQVVFEYRPLSFRVGALLSALATVGLMLLCGLAARTRFHAQDVPSTVARRVFHNAAFPMATSLLNKILDVGLALVMFRVLQAEGVGAYTFAGVLVGYFDILVNFGLGTLITREVARDHAAAARYLGNSLVVRLVLWLVSGAVVALLAGPGAEPLGITPPIALTIWLLWLALLPGILSGGLSALFMAHERMTSPAVVTVITTLMKVGLGLVALAAGWGYVGLAAVALVTNTITALILLGLYSATLGLPGVTIDWRFSRSMATVSLPLMVNNLLNSVFFRIDALLLKPLAGDVALGWYSTAYKFIDGLQIIPSSFVLAVFPLLSRHATGDRARLARLTGLSLKTLLTIALPISVGTTLVAEPIIQVFAGPSYLPESARALQILVWFVPLSFVNGLLQYVLIALGREAWITRSFLLGASFNLLANLALIPAYGYLAASAVTVASELVLLAPFWRVIRQELPPIDLLGLAWRPTLAALAMAGPVWIVSGSSVLLAIPTGAVVYGAVLLLLGGLDAADRATLRSLITRKSPASAIGTSD